jgi:hypothetical protein
MALQRPFKGLTNTLCEGLKGLTKASKSPEKAVKGFNFFRGLFLWTHFIFCNKKSNSLKILLNIKNNNYCCPIKVKNREFWVSKSIKMM